jgi:hypothetical protein
MLPIEAYGCIGDCRSLALVGTNGSIEWLCWPRFDSHPVFWSLLDDRGGFWSLAPITLERSRRTYLEDTNVLCTEFHTASGRCRVLDFMPVSSEQDKYRSLRPEHELMRIVGGLEGTCEVSMCLRLGPDFGTSTPQMIEQLEPPGFWGLNYGLQTPLVVLAAHLAFGAILGFFYRPPSG